MYFLIYIKKFVNEVDFTQFKGWQYHHPSIYYNTVLIIRTLHNEIAIINNIPQFNGLFPPQPYLLFFFSLNQIIQIYHILYH